MSTKHTKFFHDYITIDMVLYLKFLFIITGQKLLMTLFVYENIFFSEPECSELILDSSTCCLALAMDRLCLITFLKLMKLIACFPLNNCLFSFENNDAIISTDWRVDKKNNEKKM